MTRRFGSNGTPSARSGSTPNSSGRLSKSATNSCLLKKSLQRKHLNQRAGEGVPQKHGRTFEDYVGVRGLKRFGKKNWRRHVADVVERLKKALEPEYVVLGGGNAKHIKDLPPDTRMGDNRNAFVGGSRLWEKKPQPFDGNEKKSAAKRRR